MLPEVLGVSKIPYPSQRCDATYNGSLDLQQIVLPEALNNC
jgi:hypothetical protein